MPPSSLSDDTPAWIKGDLPHDPPETGPAATNQPTHAPDTAIPADPAELSGQAGTVPGLPAAAGETGGAEPSDAPALETLEAAIAERLEELDAVLNDAD